MYPREAVASVQSGKRRDQDERFELVETTETRALLSHMALEDRRAQVDDYQSIECSRKLATKMKPSACLLAWHVAADPTSSGAMYF